uniref:Putative sigma-70 region domain containing protein n=1 Tax=viral metagenome TaxID=1070528 RepID=A0A6H1Z939_9ZZZZ
MIRVIALAELTQAISQLTDERDRDVARWRVAGYTYRVIGDRLDVTCTRARQIALRADRRIRKLLGFSGEKVLP